MSRLTCSYDNNPGYLTVVRKGFAFTCSAFSIKIKWKEVKNMTTGSRWENGKTNATISVELLKERAPKPSGEIKDGSTYNPKKVFLFSAFHDFLGTSDNLMRSWKAYNNRKSDDINPDPSSIAEGEKKIDADVIEVEQSVWSAVVSLLTGAITRARPSRAFIQESLNFFFGMNLLVLLSALLLSVVLLLGFLPHRQMDSFANTRRLFASLEQVRQRMPTVPRGDVHQYYGVARVKRDILGNDGEWVEKLQLSVEELANNYVFLQLKMSELRQRRADRLFRSHSLAQSTGATVSVSSGHFSEKREWLPAHPTSHLGAVDVASLSRRKSKGLSVGTIGTKLKRIADFLATAGCRLVPWRWREGCAKSVHDGAGSTSLRHYEEPFGSNVLSQLVTAEDDDERHECLHLVSELVQIAELSEEVFTQFVGVLMNRVLDALSTGHFTSHQWSSIPPGLVGEISAMGSEPFYDAELVLKVIWMRRHMDSLFRQDPLEPSDSMRRVESLEYAKLRERFLMVENHLSQLYTRNETSKEALLTSFYKNIILRDSNSRKESLRNIIDELLFWDAHQELWADHVSQSVTAQKSGKMLNALPLRSTTAQLHWDGLPVFRGLLCFSESPRLMRGDVDVLEILTKTSRNPDNIEAHHSSGNYRLLHVQATALQQLNEDAMERWINELELFIEALADISSRHRRTGFMTPIFSSSPAMQIRTRLINVLKLAQTTSIFPFRFSYRDADERSIRSLGSTDPALQAAYTSITGLPWDSMGDIPYSILNRVLADAMGYRNCNSFYSWNYSLQISDAIALTAKKTCAPPNARNLIICCNFFYQLEKKDPAVRNNSIAFFFTERKNNSNNSITMTTPVENWGELKLSAPEGHENSESTLGLISLPKGMNKGNVKFSSRPIVSLPLKCIVNASGTTKNDISLTLQPRSSITKTKGVDMELTSVRFAVPNTCIGYEQTEEAGKEILRDIQVAIKTCHSQIAGGSSETETNVLRLATIMSGEEHKDEKIVCIFDDVTLAYPPGKYKLILSNHRAVLEEKKKGAISFPLSDVSMIYVCDVPSTFSKSGADEQEQLAQYVVLILKTPIRSTSYAHVVISCPPGLSLDENHPWECELKSQQEINELLHLQPKEGKDNILTPSMSGPVSEILMRAFKALTKVPALSGKNDQYFSVLTQRMHSCMRSLYRSSDGLLYVLKDCFLFLHRPALKLLFSDVTSVEVDESGVGTFQLTVITRSKKHVFSAIDKAEKDGLLRFLEKVTSVERQGDSDVDEEIDDDDSEEDSEASDSEADDEEDEEDRHKKKHRHHSDKKHRKHKHRRKDTNPNHKMREKYPGLAGGQAIPFMEVYDIQTWKVLRSRSGDSKAGGSPESQFSVLRREETHRIVQRVASHFAERLSALQKENAELKRRIATLGDNAAVQQTAGKNDSLTSSGFRSSTNLRDDQNMELEFMKNALLAEKRQRLLVEEQTQKLTEQHLLLLNTLEHRLRKQESQIRDIIRASEMGKDSATHSQHSSLSSSYVDLTPRHLLRQHLSQNIKTQEVLGKYRYLVVDVKTAAEDEWYRFPEQHEVKGIQGDDIEELTTFLDHITEEFESLDSAAASSTRSKNKMRRTQVNCAFPA
eukprot:gene13387-9213_t